MRKGLRGQGSSVGTRSAVKKQKKEAECLKEISSIMDGTDIQTQKQPEIKMEDTLNVYEATNHNNPSMVPPGFELMHKGRGSDAHSNPSDKELITTNNRISPSNRNADALTDNSTTQGDKNNHLVEAPNPSSLEHLALKDEGNMLDRPLQPSLLNAGSSQCPTERSIPSHLVVSQIPELQLPFDKESHFWSIIEEYDVFKNLPQQPHFLPLRDTLPGLREGTAFGLMKSFATIAESTRKLSIKDSLQTFHEKIDALLYLEEHGFSVQELLNCLNKLLQIKSDYTKKREDKCKLNLQIFHKASSVAHMQSLLDENEKSIAELEMKLAQLRLDAHNMSQEIENDESELSRIEDASNHFQKACDDEKHKFHSILAELQQKLLT